MAQTPYLGSKISLISKLDIRYEGILYTVDSNESTIALAKVRSFGTENRLTEHPVKPRPEVYEYIIFKASDIKDLVVCEGPKQPEPGDVEFDPAIVSVSKPSVHSEPPTQQPPMPPAPTSTSPSSTSQHQQNAQLSNLKHKQSFASHQPPPYHQKQVWQSNNRFQQQQQQPYRQGYNRPFNQQQQNQGGFNNQRQYNTRPFNRATAPKEKLKFDNDYDFEKANEQFQEKLNVVTDELADKIVFNAEDDELNSEGEDEEKTSEHTSCYDKKSSFFDSISCESREKAEGRNTRPDWRKERQVNSETFGQNAVRSQAYYYRNRFNNQNRYQGNRSQQAGSEQRYNQPRQNNNGPGGYRPRFNNNQQQQNRDNSRQNHAFY